MSGSKLAIIVLSVGNIFQISPAYAQSGFICVLDQATGFERTKGTNNWSVSRFKTESARYLITKKSETLFELKEFGDSDSASPCKKEKNSDFLECEGIHGKVSFSFKSLRFQVTHPWGYVISDPSRETKKDSINLTPYIAIGRCTTL